MQDNGKKPALRFKGFTDPTGNSVSWMKRLILQFQIIRFPVLN